LSSFWLTLKQQWTIKISPPLFSILSLAAILVGSRDHRTHFWKGAIQGPFHQSLVAIGPVVSEEKIKMWNVDGRTTDDRRRTKSDDNSSHGLKARWAKNTKKCMLYWYMNRSYITCWNMGSNIWTTDIWTDDNTLKYEEQLGAAVTNKHRYVRGVFITIWIHLCLHMEWRTSYYTHNIQDKSYNVLCTYVNI
jgi:hypothetical protein